MNSSPLLMTQRFLSGAFIGGIVIITVMMLFVAPDPLLPEPWVLAVLLGLVAVVTLVSVVMVGRVPAASPGDDLGALMSKVQSVHILRLALMEAPVFVALALMFISSEPSWLTVAITAAPTVLLMLVLVFPHEGVLRRYERALDAAGARTQLTDKLLGRVA
ncbi:hypothetical protein [Ornithinimicrobium cavernae]|uniref:hypothetical protein n=1 Tax=Ornithinimicrobium cavernae TaxID=2666047 RepID=UPI000D68B24A|nr:hypothetical protein [Ornithinimicrobium cavernae]